MAILGLFMSSLATASPFTRFSHLVLTLFEGFSTLSLAVPCNRFIRIFFLMIGSELHLKFYKNKAWLGPEKVLTFSELQLPSLAQWFYQPAYWLIKVLRFQEDSGQLSVEVLSYHLGKTAFPQHQLLLQQDLQKVQGIQFRSINTAQLVRTTGKQTHALKELEEEENQQRPVAVADLPVHHYQEAFSIPLREVHFKLGGVYFYRKVEILNQTVEVNITNYEIREEYDAVKNYFANVLKSKVIQVNLRMEYNDREILLIQATSPEIQRINKALIDNVRFEFINQTLKKKVQAEIDKSLFTMDEYFGAYGEEKFRSNTFYQHEGELLEDLLSVSQTMHYQQLRYLSGIHAHHVMKLRFVHKPFSFLFLIEGERNYHIVWETLDTREATYVWHVEKDRQLLPLHLRKIEDILNLIKVQGKTTYMQQREDAVQRIYHDYSNLVDGFVKWKAQLEHYLT